METRYRPYYCYLENGIPKIKEERPDNFADLPFNYQTNCPNAEVAKKTYQTNLRIMQWRNAG